MKTRESSTRFILTVCAALLDWLTIAAAIFAAKLFDSLAVYASATIVIASRQHALGVIAHEAIHWPKDGLRKVAVVTMKYLCAWPILMHFDAFREIHLAHHRHLNSASDPDFVRNQPQDFYAADSLWGMLRYALGLNRRREKSQKPDSSGILRMSLSMAMYWCAIIAFMYIYGYMQLFLLYWVLPLFTWFIFFVRLRGIFEHTGIERQATQLTRSIRGNFLSNFLFLPHAIGMHGEHHRNARLPWYTLRHERFQNQNWQTTTGVFAAIMEVFASTAWYKRKFGKAQYQKAEATATTPPSAP
jgi:fatty acid desaturase